MLGTGAGYDGPAAQAELDALDDLFGCQRVINGLSRVLRLV